MGNFLFYSLKERRFLMILFYFSSFYNWEFSIIFYGFGFLQISVKKISIIIYILESD